MTVDGKAVAVATRQLAAAVSSLLPVAESRLDSGFFFVASPRKYARGLYIMI